MGWNSRQSKQYDYHHHHQQQQQLLQQHWAAPPSNSRPPLPPGFTPVPSWERRFCTNICRIPWRRVCEAKELMGIYKNVFEWDDLEAREAFHNAKSRYWAEINGFNCDISLPDPNLYIDKVDYDAHIDPELVTDLEKQPPPLVVECKYEINNWDSLGRPIKDSEWNDRVAPQGDHTSTWDVHMDWPIVPTGWDDGEDHFPVDDTNDRGISLTAWNICSWEQSKNTSNNWNNSDGWSAGSWQADTLLRANKAWNGGHVGSWNSGRDNLSNSGGVNSPTGVAARKYERNSSWGHYDSRNHHETGWKYAKREGGSFGSRFTKSRYQIHATN